MSMKVLVVEDSETLRSALRKALQSTGLFTGQVLEAADGLAGLRIVEDNSDVELILTDWEMPHLTGVEMATRLRASGYTMPIVMVTRRAGADDRAEALAAGVDELIEKPISPQRLIEALSRVLDP
jgi:two-component system chemotaxis response regulator CheY